MSAIGAITDPAAFVRWKDPEVKAIPLPPGQIRDRMVDAGFRVLELGPKSWVTPRDEWDRFMASWFDQAQDRARQDRMNASYVRGPQKKGRGKRKWLQNRLS